MKNLYNLKGLKMAFKFFVGYRMKFSDVWNYPVDKDEIANFTRFRPLMEFLHKSKYLEDCRKRFRISQTFDTRTEEKYIQDCLKEYSPHRVPEWLDELAVAFSGENIIVGYPVDDASDYTKRVENIENLFKKDLGHEFHPDGIPGMFSV